MSLYLDSSLITLPAPPDNRLIPESRCVDTSRMSFCASGGGRTSSPDPKVSLLSAREYVKGGLRASSWLGEGRCEDGGGRAAAVMTGGGGGMEVMCRSTSAGGAKAGFIAAICIGFSFVREAAERS